MQELILAGEGKGGSGGHTPEELDDTLRSKQTIRLLFAISEGEIESIDQIYLNKVPISKYSGHWSWRAGLSNQEVINGFVNVQAPQTQASTPITESNPFILTVPEDVDAVRFTLLAPVLRALQEDKDLGGAAINLQVFTRPTDDGGGAPYVLRKNVNKFGKASNPYAWDIKVERPANVIPGDHWQIKINRTNPELSGTAGANSCNVIMTTYIYYKKLIYPHTALVGITLTDAEEFGSSIPAVVFKGKWIKVKIPSNYTPWITGSSTPASYTGTWDLTFKPVEYWTSNIAWVIFDVLTHTRRGLVIPITDVDKVSFYELSLIADQLIPDGKGGWCPRYSVGNQYYTRETAPKILAEMLALCNAQFGQNEFGQLSIITDHPNMQVSKIVTNANVIEGLFNYSSSDMENRTTQVNVTYNNRLNFNETDTTTIPDETPIEFEQQMLDRYGYIPTDIPFPGCTYEAQAVQKARHTFYTNCVNTKIISFQVMMAGLTYSMGEVLSIMDSENAQKMQHAIVKSSIYTAGNTLITLDRELAVDPAVISKAQFYATDASTALLKNIQEQGTTTDVITIPGDFPPFIGGPIIVYGSITPQLMRVAAIEKEEEYYSISCIEYDPAKWSYIDSEIIIGTGTGDFVNLTDFVANPVTDLTAVPRAYTNGLSSGVYLDVYWTWTAASEVKASFQAAWRRDNRDFTQIKDIEATSFDIPDALPGIYEVTVWAVHPSSGVRSAPTFLTFPYKITSGLSELQPPVNPRIKGTSGAIYETQDMALVWDFNTANNASGIADALKDYVVEIWAVGGSAAITSYEIPYSTSLGGEFIFTFASNVAVFGAPTRQYQVKIYSRDLAGDLSNAVAITVNNPAPVVSAFNVSASFNAVYVEINPITALDLKSYRVYRSENPSGPPTVLLAEGNTNYFNIAAMAGIEYWYSVSALDSFGTAGEVISSRQSATATSTEANTYTFANLLFTPNSPAANYISWSSFQVSKNGSSPITVDAGNVGWTSGILYLYYIDNDTTLNSTTSLGTAVQGRIVGSYHGGTEIVADEGRAYMDGDMLIAGTVGANQLFSGELITQKAQIGDVLESTTFNWGPTYAGWRLDKSGTLRAAAVEIRSPSGALVFSTGRGISGNFIDTAPSGNMFPNSDFASGIQNWVLTWYPGGGTNYTIAWDLAGEAWSPAGGHSLGIVRSGTTEAASDWFDVTYEHWFPVASNQYLEVSAYIASHRCSRALLITFWDINKTYISETGFIGNNNENGGQALTSWDRVGALLTTPGTCRYVRVTLRLGAATGADPYGWITKIFLGIPKAGQTELSPWSAASASGAFAETSQLTNVNSPSLIAGDNGYLLNSLQQWNQISGTGLPESNATRNHIFRQNSQPTAHPDGSALATADLWFDTSTLNPRTYSWNGFNWVLQGDITANNTAAAIVSQGAFATISQILKAQASTFIEAGAVGSLQIDTAAITTAHILNAAITNAKIADLSVTTGKITDLSVETLKIANRAVTVPVGSVTAAASSVGGTVSSIKNLNTGVLSTTDDVACTAVFSCTARITAGNTNPAVLTLILLINGVQVYNQEVAYTGIMSGNYATPCIQLRFTLPANTSQNLEMRAWVSQSGTASISYKGITVIGLKK